MKEPATAAELRVPCRYLRKSQRPRDKDDFHRNPEPDYNCIGEGVIKLVAKTGTDTEIADGLENITTYDAVDRWKYGILTTDMIELHDGRKLHIRKSTNWMEQNKWLVMTLVYREVAIEGVANA